MSRNCGSAGLDTIRSDEIKKQNPQVGHLWVQLGGSGVKLLVIAGN